MGQVLALGVMDGEPEDVLLWDGEEERVSPPREAVGNFSGVPLTVGLLVLPPLRVALLHPVEEGLRDVEVDGEVDMLDERHKEGEADLEAPPDPECEDDWIPVVELEVHSETEGDMELLLGRAEVVEEGLCEFELGREEAEEVRVELPPVGDGVIERDGEGVWVLDTGDDPEVDGELEVVASGLVKWKSMKSKTRRFLSVIVVIS